MAWASTAERPKASGSVEGTVTTEAARKAAGMSVQWPTRRTMPLSFRRLDQAVEILHVGIPPLRVAGEDIGDVGEARIAQLGRRFDQHLLAFPAGQAGGEQHHALVRRHIPGLAQGLDPLRGDRTGREDGKVRAAMDHPDPLARLRIERADQIARVMRNWR